MIDLNRRPRMGLLLISPERFQTIGEGTARGSYKERKQKEAEWMAKEASAIAEVTFPGVIYTAEDVKRAIDAFVTAKVDYVLAIYLGLGGGLRVDSLPAGYARLPGAVLPSDAGQDRTEGHP